MTSFQPIQDSIHLHLTADSVVVNETAKINVVINALVEDGKTDADLRAEIRSTLRSFIDADWQIANLSRSMDQSGVERVRLDASVRVGEKENFNLDDRADKASRKGLRITDIRVDTSIPEDKMREAKRALRMALLKDVLAEVSAVREVTAETYRIHSVQYSDASPSYPKGRAMAMTASYESASYGGSDDSTDAALGNAQKIVLSAVVVLAKTV